MGFYPEINYALINRSKETIKVYKTQEDLINFTNPMGKIYPNEVYIYMQHLGENMEGTVRDVKIRCSDGSYRQGVIASGERQPEWENQQDPIHYHYIRKEKIGNETINVFKVRRDTKVFYSNGKLKEKLKAGTEIGLTGNQTGDNYTDCIAVRWINRNGQWKKETSTVYVDLGINEYGSSFDTMSVYGKINGSSGGTSGGSKPKPDRTAPKVWFNGLEDGQKITGDTLHLSIGIHDNKPMHNGCFDIYIDGSHIMKGSIWRDEYPYAFNREIDLEEHGIEEGNRKVKVVVTDDAGNEGVVTSEIRIEKPKPATEFKPVCWIIDNGRKTFKDEMKLLMTFENYGECFFASPPHFSKWALYDGKPETDSGGRNKIAEGGLLGGKHYKNSTYRLKIEETIDISGLEKGKHILYLRCVNNKGKVSDCFIKEVYIGDKEDPNAWIASEIPRNITEPMEIVVGMRDNFPVEGSYAKMYINGDYVDKEYVHVNRDSDYVGKFTFDFPESLIGKGNMEIEFMVYDEEENREKLFVNVSSDMLPQILTSINGGTKEVGVTAIPEKLEENTVINVYSKGTYVAGGQTEIFLNGNRVAHGKIPNVEGSIYKASFNLPKSAKYYGKRIPLKIRVTDTIGRIAEVEKTVYLDMTPKILTAIDGKNGIFSKEIKAAVQEFQKEYGLDINGTVTSSTKRSMYNALIYMTFPLLKVGSKGDDVTKLQQDLTSLGYDVNGIDGMFGNGLKAGVIKFQTDNNLSADGLVGYNTKKAIVKALNKIDTATTTILLQEGSKGEAVIEIQELLTELGYDMDREIIKPGAQGIPENIDENTTIDIYQKGTNIAGGKIEIFLDGDRINYATIPNKQGSIYNCTLNIPKKEKYFNKKIPLKIKVTDTLDRIAEIEKVIHIDRVPYIYTSINGNKETKRGMDGIPDSIDDNTTIGVYMFYKSYSEGDTVYASGKNLVGAHLEVFLNGDIIKEATLPSGDGDTYFYSFDIPMKKEYFGKRVPLKIKVTDIIGKVQEAEKIIDIKWAPQIGTSTNGNKSVRKGSQGIPDEIYENTVIDLYMYYEDYSSEKNIYKDGSNLAGGHVEIFLDDELIRETTIPNEKVNMYNYSFDIPMKEKYFGKYIPIRIKVTDKLGQTSEIRKIVEIVNLPQIYTATNNDNGMRKGIYGIPDSLDKNTLIKLAVCYKNYSGGDKFYGDGKNLGGGKIEIFLDNDRILGARLPKTNRDLFQGAFKLPLKEKYIGKKVTFKIKVTDKLGAISQAEKTVNIVK
ncbi:peptidoglycan-binding domain-containing protein [Tepidibacter formicigenes]|jgi:peptidoglycan hydrolase-like protein with peptidoglycan-binding domain|uniref:Putative peptidoglycan binding domain-containing protein n=1 Tax=Tepidibacter formicigenes DSM 15518 TaxID=1123349 RepID=A0A1M6TGS6_9FIRM|nr:peptidoglycan-binding domain-containing protein [Tepidibacter formicigenes]SHK55968.1 Putative peptidoglycan binding domain-containing protein [Tepidibacter formicigenes DSM 15518]